MIWVKWSSLLMFLAVGLGAFGTHALKTRISEYHLEIYKTGILYHMIHAMGLLGLAWFSTICSDPKVSWSAVCFITGIVLFSGSLYLFAVSGKGWLGFITPFGGLSFLLGWLILFLCSYK